MENRIRIVRAERRLSQRHVAKQAGIDPSRFWRIENDFTEPTPDERRGICRVLGCGDGEVWMPEPSAISA